MAKGRSNQNKGANCSKDAKMGQRIRVSSKGRSTRNQRREEEAVDAIEATYRSKSNPYAWYANFPNFAKDVAQLAFGTPVGQPIYVNGNDYVANAGIMTLYFVPGPGLSEGPSSPLNRQATRFQSYLRSIQRAASSYDAADTMMYLLGIDSLYTYWAYLRRAYGVAQLFTPTNKYYPRRLLQAMGVDPDDIIFHLADFRAFINRYALNIGRFAMPKSFDLTQRHMWMANGIYVDSKSSRAQTYMFVPRVVWQWDNTVTTGSQLTLSDLTGADAQPLLHTFDQLVQIAETLVSNFNNDDDTMNISGDLYRAFGPEGLLGVEETPSNYAVVPVYDETVLSQIENCTIVGELSNGATPSTTPAITQNPEVNNGAILFQPYAEAGMKQFGTSFWRNFAVVNPRAMLNAHVDSPSPEWVMEATRLVAVSEGRISVGALENAKLSGFGTDLITDIRVCVTSLSNPQSVQFLRTKTQTLWLDAASTATDVAESLELAALFQQFDWAPMLYVYSTTDGLHLMAADVDNFTSLSHDQLYNIHEAALLSVLDIPDGIKS